MSGGRSRSRRGGGSVYYDKSRARWIGVLDLGADAESRQRIRRKVSARTEAEAWDKLDELRAELKKAGTVGRQDITVETVLHNLLASPPARWASSNTLAANTDHAERIIKALGKVRYSRFTVGQGERFLRQMAADGYSRSTMSRTRSVLIEAERRARREGLVTRNVAADIEVPAGMTRASKAMTVEQVGRLLALDLTAWWRAFILTGVTAGLRPGELLGLRWEDVDFDAGVIRVRRSLKRREGTARDGLVLAGLKTERSRRTQRMGKAARGALAALRREQAADRLRLGEHYADSGLVFADSAGRPNYPQQVWAGFKDLCEAAGLGRDWQPREMRHTWVSQLSHAGVDIEVIADAAGHVNSNVTRTVYRHQLADEITATAAVMDQIYGASS